MIIKRVSPTDWAYLSAHAMRICFERLHHPGMDRIDFALLAVDEQDIPKGFITAVEHTRDHLYWQFGGTFPGTKDTVQSYRAYGLARDWCKDQGYKSISTFIENTNVVMLKFAMKLGFRIVGVKHVFGQTLVELFLNL